MAEKDVSLVIKAKEQATKAIDSVADALRVLSDVQQEVAGSASKTDGVLGQLREELANLDREARGLAAFNRVAKELDKAANAVGRLDAAAAAAVDEQKKLGAASAAASESTARLRKAADEAKAAYERQKAAVAGLTAEQKKDEVATKAARVERDRLKATMNEANSALRTAEGNERRLQTQLEKSGDTAKRQQTALAEANVELAEISSLANKASSALGGVEATQEAVAAASARAAADMQRVNAAMNASTTQRSGPANVAGAKSSLQAWREAEAEVKRLAIAMKGVEQPTREMQTAMLLAQATAKKAKQDYTEQRIEMARLAAAKRDATAATVQEKTAAAQSTTVQHQLAPAVRATGAAMGATATQTFRMRDAFRGVYGESRQAMNMFQRFRAEILSLTASYVGLYAVISGVGKVIDAQRAIEAAQSRLGVVFKQNTTLVGVEINWLRQEALRLGISFTVLSDEYGKFAIAARSANFEMENTRRIFLAIAEAGRVSKLSTEQMSGIFLALTQMISKGKITAEELRRQLGDRLAGAFNAMADALGYTTAELDKLMSEGKLFSNEKNMLAFANQLTKTFGSQLPTALETTTTQMGIFEAVMFEAQKRIGDGGFWEGFGNALRDINKYLMSDEGTKMLDGVGAALGKLMGVFPAVIQNLDKFVLLFKAFVTLKLLQVFTGLMGNMRGLSVATAKARTDVAALLLLMQVQGTSATGQMSAGMTRLMGVMFAAQGVMVRLAATARALWAAIGGWPGLLITGLSFVITSLAGKWLTSVDKASEALNEHERIVGKVSEAYVNAKGEVENWKKALESLTATEIELNTAKLQDQLVDARKDALAALIDTTSGLGLFTKGDERAAFEGLIRQFRRGEISASDFKTAVDKIAQANPNLDRGLIEPLLKSATAAADAEKAIEKNNAALRVKRGVATEADRALLGLANALDSVNASADTTAIDAYTAALKKLGEAVPDIKQQIELTDKRAEIEKTYKDGIDALMSASMDADTLLAEAKVLSARRTAALEALAKGEAAGGGRGYIDRLIGAESSGNASARNSRSSATGLAQFTERTWAAEFAEVMPDLFKQMGGTFDERGAKGSQAILDLRLDPDMTRKLLETFTERNARALAAEGFAATDTNKYLAHFLGVADALKVLAAPGNTPLDQLVSAGSRAANPEIFGKNQTARDLIGWSAGKMGSSDAQVQAQSRVTDLLDEARKKQADFNKGIEDAAKQREFEVAQMQRVEREQKIMEALQKAEADAIKGKVTLTDAQRESIRQSVGAQYDAEAAERGRLATLKANTDLLRARNIEQTRAEFIAEGLAQAKVDAESEYGKELAHTLGLIFDVTAAEKDREKQRSTLDTNITTLEAQQQLIMQQIETAQTLGNSSAVEELRLQLQGLNADLMIAYDAMIAFWKAQDPATNPNAAAAVANLERAKSALRATGTQAVVTGKQINDMIAQGGAQAFDRFAEAIANGANAWDSFKDAFLQFAADFLRQIAQMIIQAAILQALTGSPTGGGGGAGGGIAGFINGLFRHDGGMVGSGGGYKSVWAGHFANATRYHSGGIVGLRPNEVPAILEKGEEVLDANDPRHRNNGGGGEPVLNAKIVNVLDGPDVLANALADERGQRVLMNFFRNNARAIQGAIAT